MTAAPAAASFSAMARPMPRPAPVIRATLESRVKGMRFYPRLSAFIGGQLS
jgi:hypothetical protein